MPVIRVSSEILRQKAQKVRQIVIDQLELHNTSWQNILDLQEKLPGDLRGPHSTRNTPWNEDIKAFYARYSELAKRLEEAANAIDNQEKGTKQSFETSSQII